ncbi:MAG TPA: hypothetical protein VN577_01385 [Terriglobales bacterium]|nr:hypothetical protein [Terriglobales bacterium]
MPKAKKNAQNHPPEVLTGWKAIGDYLGIGTATAQRWARSGMPVKRQGDSWSPTLERSVAG